MFIYVTNDAAGTVEIFSAHEVAAIERATRGDRLATCSPEQAIEDLNHPAAEILREHACLHGAEKVLWSIASQHNAIDVAEEIVEAAYA